MTDAPAEQAAPLEIVPEQEIDFRGRNMWVRMPRPEQLLVWKRTLTQLQTVVDGDWTADSVMTALERLRRIIDSVLVNKADVTWLDDQFLDGTLTFQQLTPMITLVVEAFADAAENEGNRETRRAVKPAKKARRKAPSA
jgi:hypothetical protein